MHLPHFLNPEFGDDDQAAGKDLKKPFVGKPLESHAQWRATDPKSNLQLILPHTESGQQIQSKNHIFDSDICLLGFAPSACLLPKFKSDLWHRSPPSQRRKSILSVAIIIVIF